MVGKSLPILTNVDKGKYGVIIFENLDRYLTMDQWNRELLDKYCRQYQVVGLNRIRGAITNPSPLFI